tara:strand:- start:7 stop:294 length:288 start_codon:yes stop_codon:yes gene_type:complete
MKRYAHVENGVVTNISNWDGETPFDPGTGITMVLADGEVNAQIGATYDGEFHYTPPPTPEPTADEIEQEETRSSAVEKLKALGLNDAEIASITGG